MYQVRRAGPLARVLLIGAAGAATIAGGVIVGVRIDPVGGAWGPDASAHATETQVDAAAVQSPADVVPPSAPATSPAATTSAPAPSSAPSQSAAEHRPPASPSPRPRPAAPQATPSTVEAAPTPPSIAPQLVAPVPSAAAPCPTGRITIEELEITTTPEKIRATGYLVNRASDEVLAASWDPPMIYGLNTYGAWITILSNGTLQGPPTANGVSPHDFVLKPGQRAKFVIEEDPYLHATPARWYAVPQGLIWNTMPQCGSPAATYPSPAHAG